MVQIRSLRFTNFKGFRDHTISFTKHNVLVGANNAGKSTALSALRLISAMLPQARRINPPDFDTLGGSSVRGWAITAASADSAAFSIENLRHEFSDEETRVELKFTNRSAIAAVWSPGQDESAMRGMYYVHAPDGGRLQPPRAVAKDLVPDMAVIPMLTPLEDSESWVSDLTFRRQFASRRASRYARNAMYRMQSDGGAAWQEFKDFVFERTPEIASLEVVRRIAGGVDELDLFFREPGARGEREIGWAGDGVQIWVQYLLHIWQSREAQVLVLDEPDVYLHPDLQRRVARVALEGDRQVVIATHSVEILAEMPPASAVWVDRSRKSSHRPKGGGELSLLGRRLGSGFELGVGRALRSRVALFVEGDDAVVLRALADALGYPNVARAGSYATVPLGGFSRNEIAGAFDEVLSALGGDVTVLVLLDSDLRSADSLREDVASITRERVSVTIWRRRELESYLLVPGAIARVAGIGLEESARLLEAAVEAGEHGAKTDLLARRLDEAKQKNSSTARLSSKTIVENAEREFARLWSTPDGRLATLDPKVAMKWINRDLQARGSSINSVRLARAMALGDVEQDVVRFIAAVSDAIDERGA